MGTAILAGDPDFLRSLVQELRTIARRMMRGERPDHTLQPTALVSEAFLRLMEQENVDWGDRIMLTRIVSRTMRRVLVDYARKHRATKRYGKLERVELVENSFGITSYGDLLAVDEALEQLASAAPRVAEAVELIVFGGLTLVEAADALQVSLRTVKRDWAFARAWLRQHVNGDGPAPAAA
jgi:RNA polymerase sigma-70 factor, ECF subfamily